MILNQSVIWTFKNADSAINRNKKEVRCKYQESILSSTTPDPGYQCESGLPLCATACADPEGRGSGGLDLHEKSLYQQSIA